MRSKVVSIVLLGSATVAYFGILIEARHAHDAVVDTVAYGASLASDGKRATNTAFDPTNGSAAIGINYRLPAEARWTISPLHANTSGTRWMYVTAETPQFFSAAGAIRLTIDGSRLGELHARVTDDRTKFAADRDQQPIDVSPERSFGYRFRLTDPQRCSDRPCELHIAATGTFWHVYRFAIVGETPRFAASSAF